MIISFLTVREKDMVCGMMDGKSPNERHRVFLGDCKWPLMCTENKCVQQKTSLSNSSSSQGTEL